MSPKTPLGDALEISMIDGEVVFLSASAVGFSMTIPAARETLGRLIAALNAAATVVLIVEDEPAIREVGAALLEEAGYEVIQAECAAAALVALEGGAPIDLLFTDIQLPGAIDGVQLVHEVSRRWPDIRLLLCSGRLRPHPADLPLDVAFLPKPYAGDEMLQWVEDLMAC